MHKITVIAFGILLGLAAAVIPQNLSAAEACLVKNGVANVEIILPSDANSVETFTAQEVQEHLRLVSGADCVITTQTSGTKLPVRLGRAANVDLSGLKKNSAKIRIATDAIDIAGIDDQGDALDFSCAAGTLFGVYDFLENELGVRWLWQGDLGTTYPERRSIDIPCGEREIHPLVFSCWRVSTAGKDSWHNPANYTRFQHEQRLWLRRHRFALADALNRGHAFIDWYDRYFQAHPEWFNLLPDGRREADPYYGNGHKSLVSMCVTNPAFRRQILADWQRRGAKDIINANENDTAGKCTCPDCLAADGTGHDAERLAAARERFEANDPLWYKPLGSLSDRYAQFFLALLQEGRKIKPGCRVIGGAYANYSDPPKHTKMDKDIVLRMTAPIMYPWTPQKVQDFIDNWRGWAATGASLMFRPNFTLDGHNFPLMYYKTFAAVYDYAVKNNLVAVDMDSYMGMVAANGITNYVIAMKINEPERTVAELEDDYCAAFGQAKDIMREYLAIFEQATAKGYPEQDTGRIEGGNYVGFIFDAPRVFTPEVMQRGFALLEQAREAESSPRVQRRVEFLKTGLTDCQYVLDTQRGFEEYKASGNPRPFAQAYRKLLDFREQHEAWLYQNRAYADGFETRLWPRQLLTTAEGK